MALKQYKPRNPSLRGLCLVDRSSLWKGRPEKSLCTPNHSSGGRTNTGRTTAWKKCRGAKKLYRKVDFARKNLDVSATVERLEYDPNRTAFIALIRYSTGELSYILAPKDLRVGDEVISSDRSDIDIKPGNNMLLRHIPIGTFVHNLEMKPGHGGQVVRSAGTYAQITGHDGHYVIIRLRSGEVRRFLDLCHATIGVVSNADHQNVSYGKAGRMRLLGIRPVVRGVAMNPVDHPHGGGEGKTSGGRHPVTPWGKPTKGKKTRRNTKSDRLIVSRRKTGR